MAGQVNLPGFIFFNKMGGGRVGLIDPLMFLQALENLWLHDYEAKGRQRDEL